MPTLFSAIKWYNNYCSQLTMKHRPEWSIPLPDPLPTKLVDLQASQTLMEDVWITQTEGRIPQWLQDPDVQNGIQVMIKAEQCQEERQRLMDEAANLTKWFTEELTVIDGALSVSSSKSQSSRSVHALMEPQTSISGPSSSTNEIDYISNI